MESRTVALLLWLAPLLTAGIIAAVNSEATNAATESAEAWIRAKQLRTSCSRGWFLGYVVNPVLWAIVKFSAWTDGFTHRGLKNGTRVAAALYLVVGWLYVLFLAVAVVIGVVLAIAAIVLGFKILGGLADVGSSESESSDTPRNESVRSTRSFKKTGMFSEDEDGRTDEDGRVFKKLGMFSEEEVGRIGDDGTTFKKTGMFSEEETGRTDDEGRIFRKTGMFSEEEVGRVDADGRVFKKTGMFSEEETGRLEKQ